MLRRVVSRVPGAKKVNFQSSRKMSGGPPPPTDGIEGAVRKYLPKNEHVSLVQYCGCIVLIRHYIYWTALL